MGSMPCWDSLKDFLEKKFFEVLLKEFLGIWEENPRFNRNGRLGVPKWMTSEFVPMPNANSIGTMGNWIRHLLLSPFQLTGFR